MTATIAIATMTTTEDILSDVDLILCDRYHLGSSAYTLDGDNEWATELAMQGIQDGKTAAEIAEIIAYEWEPSDDEMMAANSCGTRWHDGM